MIHAVAQMLLSLWRGWEALGAGWQVVILLWAPILASAWVSTRRRRNMPRRRRIPPR